jgi:hypothetical protein
MTFQPPPPKAYLDARSEAVLHGWEVQELRTSGIGTHPTHGYVRAWFADLLLVRGDVRVLLQWIAKQPPEWTEEPRIEGRWAQAVRPVVQMRGSIDPDAFRRRYLPKDAEPLTFTLTSLRAVHSLLAAEDPKAWALDAAPEPRCGACGAACRWVEDAWVCTSCGDEWYPDHGSEYAQR